MQPDPLLGRHGAGRIGIELVLVNGHQHRVRVRHPVRAEQSRAPVRQQLGLLGVRHGERIDLVRRDPGPLRVHRLRRQLHPLVGARRSDHPRRQLRHRHGLRGHPRRRVHAQIHPGREPPRPAVHHTHRVPQVRRIRGPRRPRVPQPPRRAAHPLEPEVGMIGPERPRAGQRRVGQGAQRQREKRRVDVVGVRRSSRHGILR